MAIMYMDNNPIKRSEGQSFSAASAYRTGHEIGDRQTGQTHDYTEGRDRVISNQIHLPDHVDDEVKEQMDPEVFANKIEAAEDQHSTNPDTARTGRKIPVALPHELDVEQREKLLDEFIQEEFHEPYGIPAQSSHHQAHEGGDHDHRNVHAHLMIPERSMNSDGSFSENKIRELTKKSWYKNLRQSWADHVNEYLAEYGHADRIDPAGRSPGLPSRIHLGPDQAHGTERWEMTRDKKWNVAIDHLEDLLEHDLGSEEEIQVRNFIDEMKDLDHQVDVDRFGELTEEIATFHEQKIMVGDPEEGDPDFGIEQEGEPGDFKRNLVQQYYDQDPEGIPEDVQYMNAKSGTLVLGSGVTIRHQILEEGGQRLTLSEADHEAVDFALREFDERFAEEGELKLFGDEEFKEQAVERYQQLYEQNEVAEQVLVDRETGEVLYDPAAAESPGTYEEAEHEIQDGDPDYDGGDFGL